ncbi:hypothetical protein OFP75_08780 [Brachyspira hyodysenteriae]|nr:hypothetical protein [Brachyspira hyodysenteriae]MCZ9848573.1 hypothetical protein [Brachyspira hyodysenteriae]
MLDRGFTSIPNTLIYYRKRLGLTASEFEFIIAVMSLNWKENGEIRDKDINPASRGYYRQRKSLLLKGYLTFSTRNIYKDNRFCGTGTVYNFAGLKKAIEMLVEEDRAIRNMDAPVEQKYDEPSLFGEDINTEPLQPRKLIKKEKTEEEKKEADDFKKFWDKYFNVHEEVLGFKLDFRKNTKYKEYLLEHYRKRTTDNIDDALITAKEYFLRLAENKRDSIKFQNLVGLTLKGNLQKTEDKKSDEKKKKLLMIKNIQYLEDLIN